jgi:hypothetical protein
VYQYPSNIKSSNGASRWNVPQESLQQAPAPSGVPFRLGPDLTLRIELRGFILSALSVLFYVISAFVGNEWCYLIPAGVLAVVSIGILFPIIEVMTIDVAFSVVCSPMDPQVPEIRVALKRKGIFRILSFIVPSGYLNARLLLGRRTWRGQSNESASVPIPDMIQSLNHGFEARLKVPSLKRGVYQLQNVEISTCFPFAIAWCSRLAKAGPVDDAPREITVYPQVTPLFGTFHQRLAASDSSSGRQLHSWVRPSQSINLRGLREFTERDSLTHIHWSSSARTGRLMVREFEVESVTEFDVALDLTSIWSEEQFELAVVASYSLLHYGQRQGFTPELYFLPAAESDSLADLLADCPGGLAGEALAAELLARVSPLPEDLRKSAMDDAEETARYMVTSSRNNRRNIIGLLPARSGHKGVMLVEHTSAVSSTTSDNDKAKARSGFLVELLPVKQSLAQVESELELSRV